MCIIRLKKLSQWLLQLQPIHCFYQAICELLIPLLNLDLFGLIDVEVPFERFLEWCPFPKWSWSLLVLFCCSQFAWRGRRNLSYDDLFLNRFILIEFPIIRCLTINIRRAWMMFYTCSQCQLEGLLLRDAISEIAFIAFKVAFISICGCCIESKFVKYLLLICGTLNVSEQPALFVLSNELEIRILLIKLFSLRLCEVEVRHLLDFKWLLLLFVWLNIWVLNGIIGIIRR